MPTQLDRLVAQERRARLAAERQLSQRQRDLRTATERMERRSRVLTEAILEKRAQLDEMQARVDRAKLLALETEQSLQATVSDRARAETRLWQVLNTMRDGFAVFDADLRLVCANAAYLSIFDGLDAVKPGIALRDLCRLMIEEGIVDPRMPGHDWIAQVFRRYDRSPVPDMQIRLWSGQIITLSDRPLPDGGFVSLALDHTHEHCIRGAVEAVADPFAVFDRDDRLVLSNASFRALGSPGPDPAPEDPIEADDVLGQFRDAGSAPRDIGTADGRRLRLRAVPTPDGGRAVHGSDITHLAQQRAALNEARAAADASARAKSNFLSRVVSELRTPMNAILCVSEMLADDALAPAQGDMVESIRSSAEAVLALLDGILDTTAMEEGRLELSRAPLDVAACARQAVAIMRARAEDRGTDLKLTLDPDLSPRRLGDERRIRQVLDTLLDDAIKSTEGGEVELSISGSPRDRDTPSLIEIEVSRLGSGTSAPGRPATIQPVGRDEESDTRHGQSYGLSRSVCHALVEMMGGTISMRNSAEGMAIHATLDLPPVPAEGAEMV